MNQQPTISVCIATRNRPRPLHTCIESIVGGVYDRYEILIADQSMDTQTKTMVRSFRNKRIRYSRYLKTGKSIALNALCKKATGDIYVFTDDDCIASTTWLSSLVHAYQSNPDVDGVFGRVEPYLPKKHARQSCPSVFQKKTRAITTDKHSIHYKSVGMGNNMSFQKRVVQQAGAFLPWLGPGAAYGFTGGDESEYIYRVLRLGKKLLYEPSVLIYHDRWMTPEEEERLQTTYSRGLYAFWFYYVCSALDIPLLFNIGIRVKERIVPRYKTALRHVLRRELNKFKLDMKYIWGDTVSFWIGITVGVIHAVRVKTAA